MKNALDPLDAACERTPGATFPNERAEGLPDGFRIDKDGVYRRVECKGDQPPDWVKLCSPIRVMALTRDRFSEGWGRLVEITDRDGGIHQWAIPAELFAGDGIEVRRECLRLGVDLGSGRKAQAAFSDLLMQWRPKLRATTANRLGWTDETCSAFVLGDGRVIGAEDVVYQEANTPAAAAEMKASGTLEGWREAVAAPCIGNDLMMLSVSLAFAAVLLEPLSLEGGGLHLRGASSRGKSTLQRAAVSVWGSPRFLMTWRATANGLEGVATACNATLLALDEMGEVTGREAGAAAYMLANGAGKARADRAGRPRPLSRWRTMILSSGEIGLADKIAEAGCRAAAGQMVRLLDIPADSFAHGAFAELHETTDGASFADRVKAATARDFGTAGPAFVAAFLDDPEQALQSVRDFRERFKRSAAKDISSNSEGQIARALDRLSLIAAAGEMATQWWLTGWPPGAALEAASTVLELWLDGRGGTVSMEARDAVERTRAFIIAHGATRFEPVRNEGTSGANDHERPINNRAGWRYGDYYFIDGSAWAEIHKGADPRRAARYVKEAGFLDATEKDRLTKRAPRSVQGRPHCYAVKEEIIGGAEICLTDQDPTGTAGTTETALIPNGNPGPGAFSQTGTTGTAPAARHPEPTHPVPMVPAIYRQPGPGKACEANAVPVVPVVPVGNGLTSYNLAEVTETRASESRIPGAARTLQKTNAEAVRREDCLSDELFEERAAIKEFDNGQTRDAAEREAMVELGLEKRQERSA